VPTTCPLCEATCGLSVSVEPDGTVLDIRGDSDDVFSRGFICPKGVAVKGLHEDPDRLRTPMVRRGGRMVEASWGEAFAEIEARLPPILARDRDAVAVFSGIPTTHTLGALLYTEPLLGALGTANIFSAASLNSRPKQVASMLLYGNPYTVAVPDVDRAKFLLILGANPIVSNGSLLTAPDMRSRLRALRRRGGRVVVVDPRRSVSAEGADEHLRIRPGTDALLLLAMAQVLFADGSVDLGPTAAFTDGVADLAEAVAPFTPERVAPATALDPDSIRHVARDLAAADAGVVYARMGTSTSRSSTLTNWLVDVLNVLTGNLDRPGGAMFPLPAAAGLPNAVRPRETRAYPVGRWRSRVRDLPELCGELPAVCLAEEIDTPGEGQVRALLTIAGNPARSVPNSGRLQAALESLELLVCVDTYLNETAALADVVLPVPSPLERAHYDVLLYNYACRNVANYSAPVLPLPLGMYPEWETLGRLAMIATGGSADDDLGAWDDAVAARLALREGVDLAELPQRRTGPERLLDILLHAGPYGLTLADLEKSPHGLDLGPLEPRLPGALRTAGRRIDLAQPVLLREIAHLLAELDEPPAPPGSLVLVGRRHLRSNNSWMHNLSAMSAGARRCTLHVNGEDAARYGLRDGGKARVTSRTGQLVATVEITDEVIPGVVSLPHGWGHDQPGARLRVAAERPGVNANLLTDDALYDAVSGTAVLNGVPVTLAPHQWFSDQIKALD
jgi:anaerobic selenocysteine-containing dehydrogenase